MTQIVPIRNWMSCYSNPGQAIIAYVLHNMTLNHVLQSKRDVYGRTTNNEGYYIALVERLKATKKYGTNDIIAFTNSKLISNQMKGINQVWKDNLKPNKKKQESLMLNFSLLP